MSMKALSPPEWIVMMCAWTYQHTEFDNRANTNEPKPMCISWQHCLRNKLIIVCHQQGGNIEFYHYSSQNCQIILTVTCG